MVFLGRGLQPVVGHLPYARDNLLIIIGTAVEASRSTAWLIVGYTFDTIVSVSLGPAVQS